jgi:hypothetical protein
MDSRIVAPALLSTFVAFSTCAQCCAADAQCAASLGPFPYSDSAMHARDGFLAAVCGRTNGNVYNISDPALKDRFQRIPGPPHPFRGNLYSESAKRQRLEGDAVFAVVVEANSSIKYVAIIQSTGHALLDEQVGRLDCPEFIAGEAMTKCWDATRPDNYAPSVGFDAAGATQERDR